MATTTNYGWTTPDDTDLVKDGAAAIRTLGSSIDTSFVADEGDLLVGGTSDIFEALPIGAAGTVLTSDGDTAEWAALAPAASGLTLIKTQTIGTTVSSVTVTDAFSATYANYKIILTGGSATNDSSIRLTLGATTTGYYSAGVYMSYGSNTVNGEGRSNAANIGGAGLAPNGLFLNADVYGPQLAARTIMSTLGINAVTTAGPQNYHGFLDNDTQYTAFTLTAGAGTMTGGIIRVYGYQNS
jgi:hypothetical protein